MEGINKMLEDPSKWEAAEVILIKLLKDPDEITRIEADVLMKNLQRKKFTKFLKKFDSPVENSNSNEVTMQKTVSRTLSMIIPKELKTNIYNTESDSDNENVAEKKPPQKALPAIPNTPPKKPLPDVPPKPSNIQKNPVFNQKQQEQITTQYYPTLEEIEKQFNTAQISNKNPVLLNNRQTIPSPIPTSRQQARGSIPQKIQTFSIEPSKVNQIAEPVYQSNSVELFADQGSENQEYKFKMLQNYLFNQSEVAKERYIMETPKSTDQRAKEVVSPNIDVTSSISNRPPVQLPEVYEPRSDQPVLIPENTKILKSVSAPSVSKELPPVPDVNQAQPNYENGPHHGLNTVYLPRMIIGDFMRIANLNTGKGIETCGLLAGKLRKIKRSSIRQQAAYLVTHLIIPNQSGTPNSCVMENEELVAGFQIDNNLITLGWIHTHPTQTVVLSYLVLYEFFRLTHTFSISIDTT
eukprot:NODE_54_length_30443_cov_1.442954.p6 type:complete len:466 gc:universal NODE_54_length_30443_cov_1.442954:2656-1259(-)